MYIAAGTAQSQVQTAAWDYSQLTAQPWYTKVPDSAKSVISAQEAAFTSVEAKYLGTPSKNSAPRETGLLAVGVVGAVGIMGAMIAL